MTRALKEFNENDPFKHLRWDASGQDAFVLRTFSDRVEQGYREVAEEIRRTQPHGRFPKSKKAVNRNTAFSSIKTRRSA